MPVHFWSIWSMIFTVVKVVTDVQLVSDQEKEVTLSMDQKPKEQIVEDKESLIKITSFDLQSVLEKLNGLEKQIKTNLATESKQKGLPAAQVMTMSKKNIKIYWIWLLCQGDEELHS